jgi:putative membrane protein
MPKIKTFFKQFNWKIILIRILVNGVTLILTVLIIPDIYFVTPTFRSVLIIAIGLGILNAIVKPIILLVTGQFIFATFGLLLILVNALMLYILEWLFPNILVVDNILWALVAGAVLSLVSNTLENLLGLAMPIVPEENLEIRKRLEAEQ